MNLNSPLHLISPPNDSTHVIECKEDNMPLTCDTIGQVAVIHFHSPISTPSWSSKLVAITQSVKICVFPVRMAMTFSHFIFQYKSPSFKFYGIFLFCLNFTHSSNSFTFLSLLLKYLKFSSFVYNSAIK